MKRLWWLAWCLLLCWTPAAEAALISRITTWTDGQVLTHSALNAEFDEAFDEINGNLNASNLSATLTMSDGDFFDFSASNASSTTDGIRLPQATSCSSATAEGQLCWDTEDDRLHIGDGTNADDLAFEDPRIVDDTPHLEFRDSTADVAYMFHLDTATAQNPYAYFTLNLDTGGLTLINSNVLS